MSSARRSSFCSGWTKRWKWSGSAPDGVDAVGLCRQTSPDVLVVDYRLPGPDGVEVTRAVRESCPDVIVLCLTAGVNAREEEALRDAGAVGCVMKSESLDEIVAAIKRAAREGSVTAWS